MRVGQRNCHFNFSEKLPKMVVRGAYTLTDNVFNSTLLVSKLKFSGKVEKIKNFLKVQFFPQHDRLDTKNAVS